MSSLITKGNASGTGSVTLESPNTNSDFTISLPATTGTVVLTGTTPSLNGITFPATQVPSADANTLDDYEEGTWTPVYAPVTGSFTTITLSQQSGTYTRIGRMVTINCSINRTGTFTVGSASGRVLITGLPFTVENYGTLGYGATTFQCNGWSGPPDTIIAAGGTTSVSCWKNNAFNNAEATVVDMGTGAETRTNFTLTYFV